jgi:hypothetical protein
VKIKGVAVKNTLLGLEKLHGKEGLERVKGGMPPRLREQLEALHPLEWYPVELTAALHVAIRDALGHGKSWRESHAISCAAAKIELTGVYRVILRAVQYDTIWDRMERMWGVYYDAGEAKWIDRGPGHATAVFSGVAGFNDGMWSSVAGRAEVLLGESGTRGSSLTIKETSSTRAVMEALWLE